MTERGKVRFHSLQIKFVIVLLVALAVGLACGAMVKAVGDYSIQEVYLSESATNQRCKAALDHFSQFVQDQQLEVSDTREIVHWAKNQNCLYLMVESADGEVLVDSGWWDESTYYSAFAKNASGEDTQADGADPDSFDSAGLSPSTSAEATTGEDDGVVYGYGMGRAPVQFADGQYQVSVYDFSDEPLYEVVTIATYAVAIAIFVFVMLFYHQSTIKQIIKLSHEVDQIASGNLEGHITVHSQDEIGVLAHHVDSMRYSIMREMRAEQEAWNANSDLITRMSHDIRTPLTVLLGFLELLDEGEFSQEENYRSYLSICKKNAFQLKELADKLFQYFLVFGHRDCGLNLELTDAQVLLDQLIGEHEVLLLEQGWQIENQRLPSHVLVQVDPVYVKRLFDNLFSNIEKHADPSQPVSIVQQVEGDCVRVSLHNFVPHNPNPVESTNIGLKTCERIVQQMGGVFFSQKEEREFTVKLTVPIYCEPQKEID